MVPTKGLLGFSSGVRGDYAEKRTAIDHAVILRTVLPLGAVSLHFLLNTSRYDPYGMYTRQYATTTVNRRSTG